MGFDMRALDAALEDRRAELQITWDELAGQATERAGRTSERRIAASTFKNMAARRAVRDTVVLQALRWLDRAPESFTGDASEGVHIADDDTGRPSFDTATVFAALDTQRAELGLSLTEVAVEVGREFDAAALKRIGSGTTLSFPTVMQMFAWLGEPAADFVRFVPDDA